MTVAQRSVKMLPPNRRRSTVALVAGALVLALAGVGVGLALATVLIPATESVPSYPFTYVTVQRGEVESSLSLSAVATWPSEVSSENRAAGVVTGINVDNGATVDQGATLYSVNLRPVTVAVGNVPAFRAITRGVAGADVAQAQAMLAQLGFYSGEVDGKAGAQTATAIRAWQKSLGVEATGAIELGDLVFVPSLPARLVLDREILARGATLSGGEPVISSLLPAPRFVLPVTGGQANLVPAGSSIEIDAPDGDVWHGLIGDRERDADTDSVMISINPLEGESVCESSCELIPIAGETPLSSRVILVEAASGLVVPSATLVTGADGTVAVVDEDGERIPVTVVTSARGLSVIEGVDEGTRVRLPGDASR